MGGTGYPDATPVFVLGMARSGTSLVEQMLASHSAVFGAGELTKLSRILDAHSAHYEAGGFPRGFAQLQRSDMESIGRDYCAQLKEIHGAGGARHIVDKLPANFLAIGAIAAALPNARIIHCRRDAMATCFSLYKTRFVYSYPFTDSLQDLGHYYRLYQDLMAHWEKVLPGRIFTLGL